MTQRFILGFWAFLFGMALQTAAFAQTPQIRDATGNWTNDEPRVLKARFLPMSVNTGVRIVRVDAKFARHHWPGRERAHRVTAVFDQASGEWRANPVAGAAPRGDSLFIQWEVFYRRLAINQPQQTGIAVSPLSERTIGCTEADTARDLLLLRTMAQGLLVRNPEVVLPLRGYTVPTHLMVSLRNMGFTMAKTEVASGANTVRFGPPDLAMYAPRPRARVNETRLQYLRRMMDTVPDPPYRLAGWAYAQTQRDVRRRPSLRCVPSKPWCVHEAGFHLANGGFLPTPPARETVRGESRVVVMADAANAVALGLAPGRPVWHPRIWDLHIWINRRPGCRDLNCPTLIQIESPNPIVGLPTPTSTFFRSETFE
jgi:hypothetical protein